MNKMLLIFSMGVVAGVVLGILMVHESADFTDLMLFDSDWVWHGTCQNYLA